MTFLLRQIGLYLLAAWASLTLNFILPRMMPGDPITALIARMHGRLKPTDIEAIKRAYGFTSGPVLNQYFQYLSHALRGDFGISISSYPAKVASIITTGFTWTVILGVVTLVISFILGTALGVIIPWSIRFCRILPLFLAGHGFLVFPGIQVWLVPDVACLF
jgi:peptide/nickel transport system permease protein